ncbi:MAG: YicC/YloC family endoribonuclease [Candidatus Latescibacteria bacterium]|jgi:uncharacterized protein (TIGR00255 family)|nr:YicC/YloC family endoribonuclease [Candidatus Latescibacterota bacterium]
MIASMTGFGKGESENGDYAASVEIRSVNGRYADVSVHLPRSLAELEPKIKEVVLSGVSRGHASVSVDLKGEGVEQGLPVLNDQILQAYRDGLMHIKAQIVDAGQIDPVRLAALPGAFDFRTDPPDLEAIWGALEPACRMAVEQCCAMRRLEGAKLAKDFVQRIERLNELIGRVETLAPERVNTVRQRIEGKLQEFLVPEQVDENRLLMEVALLAERSDVTEELVRFRSHNAQFLETIERDEAVGRRLNFLLQEMLREANTIGSKAGDADIAHLVVEIKEEIEKLKEQVQNIE